MTLGDFVYRRDLRVRGRVPHLAWGTNVRSVLAEALGRFVAVCGPVGCARFEVRWAGRFVAAHTVVSASTPPVLGHSRGVGRNPRLGVLAGLGVNRH